MQWLDGIKQLQSWLVVGVLLIVTAMFLVFLTSQYSPLLPAPSVSFSTKNQLDLPSTGDVADEVNPSSQTSPAIDPLTTVSSNAMHLFGVPVREENIESLDLPETELNLQLLGTFTSNQGQSASALIAEQNADSVRYFVGDTVPGGAELVSVSKEVVVIRRNHQDEVIRLPRFSEIKTGPELAHRDRSFFLNKTEESEAQQNNQVTNTNSSENISIELDQQRASAKGKSLSERLTALRARYSQE